MVCDNREDSSPEKEVVLQTVSTEIHHFGETASDLTSGSSIHGTIIGPNLSGMAVKGDDGIQETASSRSGGESESANEAGNSETLNELWRQLEEA